ASTRCYRGRSPSRRLLEGGLVGLAFWCDKAAGKIGVKRPKGELAAIGILEPELAVADDSGSVQDPARGAPARAHRPEDIKDRRGAVRRDIFDDQRGAEKRRPGRVAPDPDEGLKALGDRIPVGELDRDWLLAEHPPNGR